MNTIKYFLWNPAFTGWLSNFFLGSPLPFALSNAKTEIDTVNWATKHQKTNRREEKEPIKSHISPPFEPFYPTMRWQWTVLKIQHRTHFTQKEKSMSTLILDTEFHK